MKLFYCIGALALCATSAMAQLGVISRQWDTGTVAITAGQTARLNVYYPTIPAPYAAQATCSATLLIMDKDHGVLKTLAVPQLIGGRTASIELNADSDVHTTSAYPIHAEVLTPSPGINSSGCLLIPTLEIVDNISGKTTVVVKAEITWPIASTPIALRAPL